MRNLFTDHILVAFALRFNADECQNLCVCVGGGGVGGVCGMCVCGGVGVCVCVYCVCRAEWTTSVTQRACTVLYTTQPGVAIPCVILFPVLNHPDYRYHSHLTQCETLTANILQRESDFKMDLHIVQLYLKVTTLCAMFWLNYNGGCRHLTWKCLFLVQML